MKKTLYTFTLIILGLLAISSVGFAQTKKVACVGNSITAGSYPSFLQGFLGNQDYTVRNYGLSGHTLMKNGDVPYWDNPKYDEVLAWNPDIVIIKLGTNDAKPQNWPLRENFEQDYRDFVASFKNLSSNPTIYLCYPLYAVPGNGLQVDNAYFTEFMMPIIDQIAEDNSLEIIDLNTPFIGRGNFIPDGIHPDDRGARIMAQIVGKAICSDCNIPEISFLHIGAFDQTDNYLSLNSGFEASEDDLKKLVDNDFATNISISKDETEAYIEIEMKQMMRISGYSISAPKNSLTSWELFGSKNGKSWTSLGKYNDQVFSNDDTKMFTISNTSTFKYFKLTLTGNDGSSDPSISEWQIFGHCSPMESCIINKNGRISASVEGFGDHESVSKLIDRSTDTKFCCATGNTQVWMQHKFTKGVSINKYTLTSGNDSPGRNPKGWILYASNDGEKWYKIDTQTNQDFIALFNTLEYSIPTTKEYMYYKLQVTDYFGDGSQFQLSEWQLFESDETALNPTEEVDFIQVYTENKSIRIKSSGNEAIKYAIHTVSGQYMNEGILLAGDEVSKAYPTGIYLVSLISSKGKSAVKVIL